MGYFSAIINKILPFVTTQIDLEDTLLSEISQSEKDIVILYIKANKHTNENTTPKAHRYREEIGGFHKLWGAG